MSIISQSSELRQDSLEYMKFKSYKNDQGYVTEYFDLQCRQPIKSIKYDQKKDFDKVIQNKDEITKKKGPALYNQIFNGIYKIREDEQTIEFYQGHCTIKEYLKMQRDQNLHQNQKSYKLREMVNQIFRLFQYLSDSNIFYTHLNTDDIVLIQDYNTLECVQIKFKTELPIYINSDDSSVYKSDKYFPSRYQSADKSIDKDTKTQIGYFQIGRIAQEINLSTIFGMYKHLYCRTDTPTFDKFLERYINLNEDQFTEDCAQLLEIIDENNWQFLEMILDLEIDNSEKYSKFERLGVNFMYIRDCEGLVQHKKDVQLHMLLNRISQKTNDMDRNKEQYYELLFQELKFFYKYEFYEYGYNRILSVRQIRCRTYYKGDQNNPYYKDDPIIYTYEAIFGAKLGKYTSITESILLSQQIEGVPGPDKCDENMPSKLENIKELFYCKQLDEEIRGIFLLETLSGLAFGQESSEMLVKFVGQQGWDFLGPHNKILIQDLYLMDYQVNPRTIQSDKLEKNIYNYLEFVEKAQSQQHKNIYLKASMTIGSYYLNYVLQNVKHFDDSSSPIISIANMLIEAHEKYNQENYSTSYLIALATAAKYNLHLYQRKKLDTEKEEQLKVILPQLEKCHYILSTKKFHTSDNKKIFGQLQKLNISNDQFWAKEFNGRVKAQVYQALAWVKFEEGYKEQSIDYEYLYMYHLFEGNKLDKRIVLDNVHPKRQHYCAQLENTFCKEVFDEYLNLSYDWTGVLMVKKQQFLAKRAQILLQSFLASNKHNKDKYKMFDLTIEVLGQLDRFYELNEFGTDFTNKNHFDEKHKEDKKHFGSLWEHKFENFFQFYIKKVQYKWKNSSVDVWGSDDQQLGNTIITHDFFIETIRMLFQYSKYGQQFLHNKIVPQTKNMLLMFIKSDEQDLFFANRLQLLQMYTASLNQDEKLFQDAQSKIVPSEMDASQEKELELVQIFYEKQQKFQNKPKYNLKLNQSNVYPQRTRKLIPQPYMNNVPLKAMKDCVLPTWYVKGKIAKNNDGDVSEGYTPDTCEYKSYKWDYLTDKYLLQGLNLPQIDDQGNEYWREDGKFQPGPFFKKYSPQDSESSSGEEDALFQYEEQYQSEDEGNQHDEIKKKLEEQNLQLYAKFANQSHQNAEEVKQVKRQIQEQNKQILQDTWDKKKGGSSNNDGEKSANQLLKELKQKSDYVTELEERLDKLERNKGLMNSGSLKDDLENANIQRQKVERDMRLLAQKAQDEINKHKMEVDRLQNQLRRNQSSSSSKGNNNSQELQKLQKQIQELKDSKDKESRNHQKNIKELEKKLKNNNLNIEDLKLDETKKVDHLQDSLVAAKQENFKLECQIKRLQSSSSGQDQGSYQSEQNQLEISLLQQKLAQLEKQILNDTGKFEKKENQDKIKIDELQENLLSNKMKNEKLENQLKLLQNSIESKEGGQQIIEQMNDTQLKLAQEKSENLQKQLLKEQTTLQDLKQQNDKKIQSLQNELIEKKQEIFSLDCQVKKFKNQEENSNNINYQEEQHNLQTSLMNQKITSLEKELLKTKQDFESQKNKDHEQIETLQQDLLQKKQDNTKLESQVKILESSQNSDQSSKEIMKQIQQSELSQYQDKVALLEKQLLKQEEKFISSEKIDKQAIDKLKDELVQKNQQDYQTQAQIQRLQSESEVMKLQLENQKDNKDVGLELSLTQQKLAHLEKQLLRDTDNFNASNKKQKKQIEELEKNLREKKEENGRLESKIDRLQSSQQGNDGTKQYMLDMEQAKFNVSSQENSNLSRQIERLQEKFDEKTSENQELIEELKSEIIDRKQEKYALENKINIFETQMENQGNGKQIMEEMNNAKISVQQQQITQLEKDLSKLQDQHTNQKNKDKDTIEDLKEQILTKKQDLYALENQVKRLQDQIENSKQGQVTNASSSDKIENYKQEIDNLLAKNQCLRDQMEEEKSKNNQGSQDLKDDIVDKKMQITRLESQINVLQSSLNNGGSSKQIMEDMNNAKISTLEQEINSLKKQLSREKSNNDEQKQKNTQKIRDLENGFDKSKQENYKMESKIKALENQLEMQKQSNLTSSSSQGQTQAQKEQVEYFQKQIKQLEEKLQDSQQSSNSDKSQLKDDLNDLKMKNYQLESQVQRLESSLKNSSGGNEKAEIIRLQNNLEKKDADFKKEHQKREQLLKDHEQLKQYQRKELQTLKDDITKSKMEYNQLESKFKRTETELQRAKESTKSGNSGQSGNNNQKQINELKDELNKKKMENSQLESKLKRTETELQRAKDSAKSGVSSQSGNSNNNDKKQINELKDELNKKKMENSQLESKLKRTEAELQRAKESSQNRKRSASSSSSSSSSSDESLKENMKNLEKKLEENKKEYQEEIEKLEKKLEKKKEKKKELKLQIESLVTQMTQNENQYNEEIQILKQQQRVKEEEINSLHENIEQIKSEQENYRQEMDKLNEKLIKKKEKKQALKRELEQYKLQQNDNNSEVENLKENLEDIKKEQEQDRNTIQELNEKLIKKKEKKQALKRELEQYKNQQNNNCEEVENLKENIEDIKKEWEEDRKLVQELNEKLVKKKEKKQVLKRELEQQKQELKEKYGKIENLNENIEEIKKDQEKDRKQIQELSEKLEKKKDKKKNLKKDLEKLQEYQEEIEKLNEKLAKKKDKKIKLKEQIDELKQNKESKDQELENLKENIEQIQKVQENGRQEIEILKEKLDKKKQKKQQLKQQIKNLEEKIENFSGSSSEQINKLQESIQNKQQSIEDQQSQIKEYENQIKGIQNQNQQLEQQVQDRQSDINQLQDKCLKLDTDYQKSQQEINNQLEESKLIIENLENSRQQQTQSNSEEINKLRKDLEESQEDKEKLEKKVDKKKKKKQLLKDQIKQIEEELKELSKTNEKKVKELKEDKQELQDKYEKLKELYTQENQDQDQLLNQEIEDLKAKIKNLSTKNLEHQETQNEKELEISQLQEQLIEQSVNIDSLQQQLEQNENQQKTILQETNQKYQQEIQELQQQNTEKLQEMQQNYDTKYQECEELEVKFTTSRIYEQQKNAGNPNYDLQNQKIQQLQAQNEDLQEQLQKSQQLQSQKERKSSHSSSSSNSSEFEKLSSVQEELKKSEKKLQEQEQKSKDLDFSLQETKKQLKISQNQKDDLIEKVEELEKKNDELHSEKEKYKNFHKSSLKNMEAQQQQQQKQNYQQQKKSGGGLFGCCKQ